MTMPESNRSSTLESVEITAEIACLQEELEALEERHRILDSLVAHIDECTGIIYEMGRIETKTEALRKRLSELKQQKAA